MQINISNLSEGAHTYRLTGDPKKIGLPENLTGTVVADVTIENSLQQLLVTVDACVKGNFLCDTCATEFEREIKNTFRSIYSFEQGEENEVGEDFYVLRPDENMIDISDTVRDYLTLTIGLKFECGRKECAMPRLPHSKEKNTVDPRWAQLQKLLQSEKN